MDRIGSWSKWCSSKTETSWTCTLQNGVDLCVSYGDTLSERRASLADEERKEEEIQFLALDVGSIECVIM